MIYCDHAATTPMSTEALATYQTVARDFYANSESLHQAGNSAGQLLQEARTTLAELFHLNPEGLIFTSGGTQANHLGIAALAHGSNQRQILVSPFEHASVYQELEQLATREDYQITTLATNQTNQVTPEILAAALTSATGLVVIQAINPITGQRQPLEQLQAITDAAGVPFFCDAVQAIGKTPFDGRQLAGFSASGHKFNGPKGCGFLYLAPEFPAQANYRHVFQQQGFLPGTLDTAGIVSMVTALQENIAQLPATLAHLSELRQLFYQALAPELLPVAPANGYPGICGLLLPHRPGQEVVTKLGQQGICLSTVSACSLKDPRPDPTLRSLGLTTQESERYLRVSFGAENTLADATAVALALNDYRD